MIEQFLAGAGSYIETNPWLALAAVFVGGVLTASSPCVLAMIPLMMSFVAGRRDQGTSVARSFGLSLVFVGGLSISFVLLGMSAALAGRMYGDVSGIWSWVVAVVCLVMGLHLAGVLKFTIPVPFELKPKARGPLGALVLGLLFGVVSAPCAAPMLVVLLTYLAGSGASVIYGGLLLLVYAFGHSVLILVAGTSMGAARLFVESRRMTRATDMMRRVGGVVIILVGVFFAYTALAPEATTSAPDADVREEAPAAKKKVARIVFVGQKEACDCTRERIDLTWATLEGAMAASVAVPVERIQLDVHPEKTERYHKMKSLMVAPGIYFLDEDDALIEMLQGEVGVEEIAAPLR